LSESANPETPLFVATPSIELKNQLGARKKTVNQKPLESLSGNSIPLIMMVQFPQNAGDKEGRPKTEITDLNANFDNGNANLAEIVTEFYLRNNLPLSYE
jgi:hypothetical protein